MRRFGLPLVTLAALAFAQAAPVQKGIKVLIDGEAVVFTNGQPQSVAGRTLVPYRAVIEALGGSAEWNKELRKITARKDNSTIELTIDEKIGKKNGAEIQMDVAPVIRNGSTLVPLRFVAESLDAKVDYDKAKNTISINTGGTPPKPMDDDDDGDGGR
ncbi:copper amine oxidase N-terminal domain-containing protein [bacterium]|nr:MAG: copper amine oxidase N-terminal domain-containing protein [bacterium]